MGTLYRKVAYPLYHWLKKDGVNVAVRGQAENQWRSPTELRALQREKLDQLLESAGRHVPYYRDLFDGIGLSSGELAEPENFSRIPVLTKATINANRDDLVSEDLSGNGLIPNSTSGSTGEALYFYTDYRSTSSRKAAEIRGKEWAGWKNGDRSVSLWGSPIDAEHRRGFRAQLHGRVTRRLSLSSYDLTPKSMDRYIREILRFKPVLFVSYAGPLEQFALYCLEKNVTFPSLKGAITSAEKLWPHQRFTIEKAFELPVFDRYGSREVGNVGQECSMHDGIHVFVDRVYMELVDDEGQPCRPGQSGRILLTDLDNFGSPMIRYEIGDSAVWSANTQCRCGRSLPMLEWIDGRTLEVVKTPSGNRIGGTFWTLLFRSKPGIRQFQVIQYSLDGIQVRFIPDSSFDPKSLDYFRDKVIEKSGKDFAIEFVEVDRIRLTESGKRRLIISHYTDAAVQ